MLTIHKYPLAPSTDTYICKVDLPFAHKILSVKNQHEKPVVYALVNTDTPLTTREIYMFPTGCKLPDLSDRVFIDTVMFASGDFVFHFYK